MKVVTAEQMRAIDTRTIERIGIPGSVLMERAGVAIGQKVKELFERRKVIVLAGGGNNGGDGIVAARELHNAGWHIKVLLLIKEDRLSPDCLVQFRIAKQIGVPIEFRTEITERDLHSALVLDAMLGTGLNKEIEGNMAKVITFLNESGSPVMSIDIPSGISSDTGQVMGVAVRALQTVTFGLPKRGHLLFPGAEYTGRLFVENIGFPEDLLTSDELNVELLGKDRVSPLIPKRPAYSHKGTYGHVLIVAGSKGKTGAALMAAKACMRTGAGLVTIGVPETLIDVFQSRVTEEMTISLPARGDGTLSSRAADVILDFISEKANVLCIGPGIGVTEETERIIETVLATSKTPLILDADGLNSLRDPGLLKKASAPVILTPHPGEMARLVQRAKGKRRIPDAVKQIEADRITTALSFSHDTGTHLVFKGVPTVIAEPGGKAFINPTGNPGMASGGTGDVLTGILSSLIAQALPPVDAALLGTYLHGLAGDLAAADKGMHALIASDIINFLPRAFRELLPSEILR